MKNNNLFIAAIISVTLLIPSLNTPLSYAFASIPSTQISLKRENTDIYDLIKEKRTIGYDISEAQKYFKDAKNSYSNKDYFKAKKFLKNAEGILRRSEMKLTSKPKMPLTKAAAASAQNKEISALFLRAGNLKLNIDPYGSIVDVVSNGNYLSDTSKLGGFYGLNVSSNVQWHFTGTATKADNKIIFEGFLPSDNVKLHAVYSAENDFIKIKGYVENSRQEDMAFVLNFKLPPFKRKFALA